MRRLRVIGLSLIAIVCGGRGCGRERGGGSAGSRTVRGSHGENRKIYEQRVHESGESDETGEL